MKNRKVFIAGWNTKEQYGLGNATHELFLQKGWDQTTKISESDLVVFTGGSDISPELYGEDNKYSSPSPKRDKFELQVFAEARDLEKPMFGICRGMQFLNVMMGGRLWQDVKHHPGADNVDHVVKLEKKSYKLDSVRTNSLHHQQCILPPGMELVGWTETDTDVVKRNASGEYKIWNLYDAGLMKDPEIIWQPEKQILGVQFHPEFMPKDSDAVQMTMNMIDWIVY